MQTAKTEKPRLGYANGGPIRCMAEGGLISKLFGSGKTETVTEKYARQDAERAAKAAKSAPAPAATPAPDAAPGGALNPANALAAREKAAGLAKGGPVKGAGGPTDDRVPIMASPGEFMVKAKAVKHLGVPFMKKINSIADGQPDAESGAEDASEPAGAEKAEAAPAPKLGAVKRKRRGKRKFWGGGLVGDELAPYVNHRAYAGAPAMPAQPLLTNGVPPPGTAVAAPTGPNFTMGGSAPAAPASPTFTDVRPKYDPAAGSPEAKAWQASRAPAPAPAAAAAPVAAATAPAVTNGAGYAAGQRLGQVVRSVGRAVGPAAIGGSTALQTASTPTEDYETRFAVEPTTLDSPVARLGRDVGIRIMGAASDLGNTLTGGLAGNFYRDKQQAEAAPAPVAAVTQPAAAAPPPPRLGAIPATGPFDASAIDPRTLTNPNAAQGFVTPGQIVRSGNSYSGAPGITGDVQFTDKAGTPLASRGTVSTVPAGGYSPAPSGASDAALFEARKAAVARGDMDAVRASYATQGQSFGAKVDPIEALINNGRPMTARKAAAIASLQAAKTAQEGGAASHSLALAKFGVDKETADLTNREKKTILSAKEAYANAKPNSVEQLNTAERLQRLSGNFQPQEQYVPLPGGQRLVEVNGLPQVVTEPSDSLNKFTGELGSARRHGGAAVAVPTDATKTKLKANPNLAAEYDRQFGEGSAAKVLGQK